MGTGPDPVGEALRRGDLEALRRALGDPADWPHTRDECGASLLVLAIYRGAPSLVEELLAAGADPNAPEDDGFPALFAAIDRAGDAGERQRVLRALLAAGADPQQRGVNDWTALHHAACRDDADAVTLLLAHGADPAARTRIDHYATPLEEATLLGCQRGAEALRRTPGVPR